QPPYDLGVDGHVCVVARDADDVDPRVAFMVTLPVDAMRNDVHLVPARRETARFCKRLSCDSAMGRFRRILLRSERNAHQRSLLGRPVVAACSGTSCDRHSIRYKPSVAASCSCVPTAAISPWLIRTMRSARRTVESRCAM